MLFRSSLEARGFPSPLPSSPSSCPVSTSVAKSEEAEAAVALVPGEVEKLKVTVGLRGEGQVELDVAIPVHSGLWALVLPAHPEPAEGKVSQPVAQLLLRRGRRGRPQHMSSCYPLPSGFQKGHHKARELCQWSGRATRRGIFTKRTSRL